jgi:hypothetical protein
MAAAYKPPQTEGKTAAEEIQRVHRIRITLTSKNVANLEKGEQPCRVQHALTPAACAHGGSGTPGTAPVAAPAITGADACAARAPARASRVRSWQSAPT